MSQQILVRAVNHTFMFPSGSSVKTLLIQMFLQPYLTTVVIVNILHSPSFIPLL